jgi:magnesium and cobalt transporter
VKHPAGVEFEVLDADPRKLKRLRVRVTKPLETATQPDASDSGAAKPMAAVNG